MAVIALTLSSFTLPFILTGGGSGGRLTTLGMLIFELAFNRFQVGPAAALASLLLLVTLALGVGCGVLILRARMRLTLVGDRPAQLKAAGALRAPGALAWLVLALVLGVVLLGALPFLGLVPRVVGSAGFTTLLERLPVDRILVNSLVPPQIATAAQLAVVYLAALGIGALRPLGKRSEWLLLAFSPWLLVPLVPLSIVGFMDVRQAGLLNTFLGLIPPTLFNVPALFVLTLFFAGRVPRWRAAQEEGKTDANAFLKHVIGPSLPLAAVLCLFLFFVNWQDVVWPLIAGTDPRHQTLGVALFALLVRSQVAPGVLAAGVLLLVVPMGGFFFLALSLLQVLYLDRLVGYSAPEPDVPPEAPASGPAAPQ